MPNWKSYESSVRLLSAIIAAHPDLKLNYQDISDRFGGDCTKSAIENRFRGIKIDAKSINAAFAAGVDPSTLSVGSTNGQGKAPKDISVNFGSDTTPKAIESQIKCLKVHVKAVKQAVAAGIDPITVEVRTGFGKNTDEVAKFTPYTASSIEHRMRPIKALAKELREGGEISIADQYGEGVTAKAVSTRFERASKEDSWINKKQGPKSKSVAGAGSAKKPRTPKKAIAKGSPSSEDEDDDEGLPATPSRKPALNKTIGGRISKTTPRTANSIKTYTDAASDEDAEIADFDQKMASYTTTVAKPASVSKMEYDDQDDDDSAYQSYAANDASFKDDDWI